MIARQLHKMVIIQSAGFGTTISSDQGLENDHWHTTPIQTTLNTRKNHTETEESQNWMRYKRSLSTPLLWRLLEYLNNSRCAMSPLLLRSSTFNSYRCRNLGIYWLQYLFTHFLASYQLLYKQVLAINQSITIIILPWIDNDSNYYTNHVHMKLHQTI